MIGREKLLKKLNSILAHSRADQTEIVYIGDELGLTKERIRQIEAKALRKLQHPSRRKRLKSFRE